MVASIHNDFIEQVEKHFTNETQRKVVFEVDFNGIIATFMGDLLVENYRYEEDTNSASYDRLVYIHKVYPVVDENCNVMDKTTSGLIKKYLNSTFVV